MGGHGQARGDGRMGVARLRLTAVLVVAALALGAPSTAVAQQAWVRQSPLSYPGGSLLGDINNQAGAGRLHHSSGQRSNGADAGEHGRFRCPWHPSNQR